MEIKVRKIAQTLLLLVAAGHFGAASAEMTTAEIQAIKESTRDMMVKFEAERKNPKPENKLSNEDIYSALGMEEVKANDAGSSNTLKVVRKGKVSLRCEEKASTTTGELQITVVDCNGGMPTVSVCEAEAKGLKCTQSNSEQITLGSNPVTFGNGAIIEGEYTLTPVCSAVACEVSYIAKTKSSSPTTAAGNIAASDAAKNTYTQPGSMFATQLEWQSSQAMKDQRQSFVDQDLSSCYQKRMDEVNADGKVKMSCDPGDTRTLQFLVDKREGGTKGQIMCSRSEDGACTQPIPIHDVQFSSGTQTCTARYSRANASCSITQTINGLTGADVYSAVRVAGSNAKAIFTEQSCGTGCTEYLFDNYKKYGNNNLKLHHKYAEEHIDFTYYDKSAITKVEVQSTRYDGFIQVRAGNQILVNPHPNDYGVNNNSSNRNFALTDVTTGFKNGMGAATARLTFSLWVTNNEGEYDYLVRIYHKTKGARMGSISDTCTSLVNRSPAEGGAEGCYQTSLEICTDKGPNGDGYKTFNGDTLYADCWKKEKSYECISSPVTGCDAATLQANGWVKDSERNQQYPTSVTGQNTSKPYQWDEVWKYSSSNGLSQAFGCATPAPSTTRTDATGGTITTTHQWCYGEQPRECRPSPPETPEEITQCRVTSFKCIDTQNGLCVKQEQNFTCETAYVCENTYGNAEKNIATAPDNSDALAKVVAESEKAKAISEALSGNSTVDADGNIKVFSGEAQKCKKWSSDTFGYLNIPTPTMYSITMLMNTKMSERNCCEGDPDRVAQKQGFNRGLCTQGDNQLAAKRMKGTAHLIELDQAAYSEGAVTENEPEADTRAVKVCDLAVSSSSNCGPKPEVPNTWPGIDADTYCKRVTQCGAFCSNNNSYRKCMKPYNDWDACAANGKTISFSRNMNTVPAGTYQEADFDSRVLSDRALFVDGVSGNGDKTYCYEHLAYDARAVVYRNGDQRYIYDDSGQQININNLNSIDEPDGAGEGNWLPGNLAGCVWEYDSTLERAVYIGAGQLLNAPGSTNTAAWLSDLFNGFNLPFSCQYSMFDVVKTVRVDSFQTWCTFDNVFSRLVQEQGRMQLAHYATQPYTGAITDTASFNFYKQGTGAWTGSKLVNGNDVRFWQWPEQCSDKDGANLLTGAAAVTDQGCPKNADIYVAICAKAGTCGALPINPVLESTQWETRKLRAENTKIEALTPMVVVQGSCAQGGSCVYNIHAWKKGVGGSVDIPLDLNWPLRGANTGWATYVGHNAVHFAAYTAGISDPIPAPMIRYCVGSPKNCAIGTLGDTTKWRDVTLSDPTALSGQVVIPATPKVTATGQCSSETETCSYRLTINVKLNAKPWHNGITFDTYKFKTRPIVFGKSLGPTTKTKYNYKLAHDCSGFTLDEFLALDLNAMDLTQFTQSVAADAQAKITEMMANGTMNPRQDAQKLLNGENPMQVVSATKNFDLSPYNGFAGQVVTLRPLYSDANYGIKLTEGKEVVTKTATGYRVEWGDGSSNTYQTNQEATHTYGDINYPPASATTLNGTVVWQTTSGSFSEGFTFKIWTKTEESTGGGNQVEMRANGSSSVNSRPQTGKEGYNSLDQQYKDMMQ